MLKILDIIQKKNLKFYNIVLQKYIRNIIIKELDIEINTNREYLINLTLFLKLHYNFKFKQLIDIIVVDKITKLNRFSIYYNFISYLYNVRLRLKIQTSEIIKLQSITFLFPSANWSEREIWDMFGILFINHPDLRRILTDYNFQGHPLKKDFPLSGFIEVFYNSIEKRIKYEPVFLTQEYRFFTYKPLKIKGC